MAIEKIKILGANPAHLQRKGAKGAELHSSAF